MTEKPKPAFVPERRTGIVAERAPAPPVLVAVHGPLLDAARAVFPAARDWTDHQVVTACVAYVIGAGLPRQGTVHAE